MITAWYVLDGAVPPPGQFGSFFIFGGTSAGAPQWSAITALADRRPASRVGWLNPTLYNLARTKNPYSKDFHDITAGNNVVTGLGGCGLRRLQHDDGMGPGDGPRHPGRVPTAHGHQLTPSAT